MNPAWYAATSAQRLDTVAWADAQATATHHELDQLSHKLLRAFATDLGAGR